MGGSAGGGGGGGAISMIHQVSLCVSALVLACYSHNFAAVFMLFCVSLALLLESWCASVSM